MTTPNVPPSDEVRQEAIIDLVLAGDWETHFTVNSAGLNALRAELDDVTDPDKVLNLTEMKGEAQISTLGSGGICLFKRDVIANRAQFEADFGDNQ